MDEGVGYDFFPSKTFCLILPKNFTWNSSSLREDSGSEDVLWMGGDVKFFRRSFFVSHYRKVSLETLRCFKKILTAKPTYGCEGDIALAVELFLSHITEKIWVLFVVSEMFWHWKPLWIGRGNHVFPSNFFCLGLPKFCIGNSSCFQKKMV